MTRMSPATIRRDRKGPPDSVHTQGGRGQIIRERDPRDHERGHDDGGNKRLSERGKSGGRQKLNAH